MTDVTQAISVETTVEIDWAELGRIFAEQASPDQAKFLLGFYEVVSDAQLAYIGSETAFDGVRSDVSGVLENLSYFISSQGE